MFLSGLDVDVIEFHRVVGSVTVFDKNCSNIPKDKSIKHSSILEKFAKHSKMSRQKMYNIFTNGLKRKLNFIARTTPNSKSLLREAVKKLDKILYLHF